MGTIHTKHVHSESRHFERMADLLPFPLADLAADGAAQRVYDIAVVHSDRARAIVQHIKERNIGTVAARLDRASKTAPGIVVATVANELSY